MARTNLATCLPYTHMSKEDTRLFYSTYEALLAYANERLDVVDRDEDMVLCNDEWCRLTPCGARVSEGLWAGHRDLVDGFVTENPYDLTDEQLDVARQWRWAVRGEFVCMCADADYVLLMNDERVFVMGAMQDDADAHVHAVPSLLLLTLLPFRDGIVCDGKTIFLSDECPDDSVRGLLAIYDRLISRGSVIWADEFIEYSARLMDGNLVRESTQRQLDELLVY